MQPSVALKEIRHIFWRTIESFMYDHFQTDIFHNLDIERAILKNGLEKLSCRSKRVLYVAS